MCVCVCVCVCAIFVLFKILNFKVNSTAAQPYCIIVVLYDVITRLILNLIEKN